MIFSPERIKKYIKTFLFRIVLFKNCHNDIVYHSLESQYWNVLYIKFRANTMWFFIRVVHVLRRNRSVQFFEVQFEIGSKLFGTIHQCSSILHFNLRPVRGACTLYNMYPVWPYRQAQATDFLLFNQAEYAWGLAMHLWNCRFVNRFEISARAIGQSRWVAEMFYFLTIFNDMYLLGNIISTNTLSENMDEIYL